MRAGFTLAAIYFPSRNLLTGVCWFTLRTLRASFHQLLRTLPTSQDFNASSPWLFFAVMDK